MRGYYEDQRPYLTNSEDNDFILLCVLAVLTFNFSLCYASVELIAANVHLDWEPSNVNMTPVSAMISIFAVPAGFYIFQALRTLYRYTAGFEQWYNDRPEFFTFELHLGIDFIRAFLLIVITGAGTGLANLVLQHTSLRANAIDNAYYLCTGFIVASVVIPAFFYTIYRIRLYRLRKLETYRQLGGQGY